MNDPPAVNNRFQVTDLGHALLAAMQSGLISFNGAEYDREWIEKFCEAYRGTKRDRCPVSKSQFETLKNTPDAFLYYPEELLEDGTEKHAQYRKRRIKYIAEVFLGLAFGVVFSHFLLGF